MGAATTPIELPFLAAAGDDDVHLPEAASIIRRGLAAHPHYVVVSKPGDPAEKKTLPALMAAIAAEAAPPNGTGRPPRPRRRLTHVRIDAKTGANRETGTRFSRTNQPMAPHTDSTFREHPQELIGFQCAAHDAAGGDSILAPIEDILSHLEEDVVALLRDAAYPSGPFVGPILTGDPGCEEIRYYRIQLERTLIQGDRTLSAAHRAAIDALDAVLARTELFHTIPMRAGQILFMHNRKVLHGRTGFAPDSPRHFYRMRRQIPGL